MNNIMNNIYTVALFIKSLKGHKCDQPLTLKNLLLNYVVYQPLTLKNLLLNYVVYQPLTLKNLLLN